MHVDAELARTTTTAALDVAAASAALAAVRPLALRAAAILAIDPLALGGLRLRAGAGPARDAWLAALRRLLPASMPWQRLPVSIEEDRLLGGLDLAASLAARRSVLQRGLLAQCHGGVLVAPMAERLPARTTAALTAVLDRRELVVEREGFGERQPAHLAVVALDEALPDDEPLSAALADRLGLDVTLSAVVGEDEGVALAEADDDIDFDPPDAGEVLRARARLPSVTVPDELIEALCQATLALGIDSARAPWWALQVARMSAALAGRERADEDDARLAARLVLAPRATRMPAVAAEEDPPPDAPAPEPPPAPPETPENAEQRDAPPDPTQAQALDELLVAAALASLPPGLLAQLALGTSGPRRARSDSEGRSGAITLSRRRGAPLGARPGDPRRGERLSLVETLRAAIPWQRLRATEGATADAEAAARPAATGRSSASLPGSASAAPPPGAASATSPLPAPRLSLRMDDLRVVRRAQHRRSTTIFLIDASGSAALHRLAEAKGAVELLLAESYVRRDEVAVIAFRGQRAELLLPPTRSLVRAKRALAGLPGGGGTPIAAALDAADTLVEQVQRHGATPSVVLLTDGRANVARDPASGRAQAEADALAAARRLALRGVRSLLIDTSARPSQAAARLAAEMRARYLPLPQVRADLLSAAVRQLAA
jgi:magnesium chelatase subunit D